MRRMPSSAKGRAMAMATTTTTTKTPRFLAIAAVVTLWNVLSMFTVIILTVAVGSASAADPEGRGAAVGINCLGPTEDGRGWRTVHVPPEKVNDDYCDCPYDGGADEAGTGACSGSAFPGGGWAGVPEPGGEHGARPTHFQCPQQFSLKLPTSRVNDGICDCCDGTDEPLLKPPCPDVCDEILADERRLLRERQENFSIGYKLRQADLAEFAAVRDAVEDDVRRLRDGLPDLKREIQVLRDRAAEERSGRIAAKRRILTEMTGGGGGVGGNEIGTLIRALTEDEMVDLIVAVCHLSGEDPDAKSSSRKSGGSGDDDDDSSLLDEYASVAATAAASGDTCVALLRAGVDVGYRWESSGGVSTCYPVFDDGDDADSGDSGDAAADGGGSKPSRKPKPPRRKDSRLGFDDSYDEAASSLAPRRSEFRRHAVAVLDHIQSIYADAEEEHDEDYFDSGDYDSEDYDMMYDSHDPPSGDDDDDGEAERHRDAEERRREKRRRHHERTSSPKESSSSSNKMDPMAIQMTRNELQERVDNVERGNRFAKRAKLLMAGFAKLGEDNSNASGQVQDLMKLALATIWHARISSADLADILYIVLSEFRLPGDDVGEDEAGNSCSKAGDISALCPPRSTVRAGKGNDAPVDVPPVAIRQAAEERCTQRLLSSDNVCEASKSSAEGDDEAEGNVDADAVEVPSNVADGYYGYYKFVPRDEEHDPLSHIFSPLRGDERQSSGDALQEQISELRKRERQTEKEITDLEDKIGGPDRKFGTDGVLFGLKDKCYKVEAGKYEYEACPFGQAYQRDVGQKGKGTNLGSYQGLRLDEKTGQPYLSFEKGLKCWQGPHRSASVYISCGSETKLISADEPETCRYSLELVSHVACDEQYAIAHGLELE